jgi:uncharacterized protein (TIGR02246 family)
MQPNQVAEMVFRRFSEAWNRHDMTDLGGGFTDDATFVNVVGMQMNGRADIATQHALIHRGPYRQSNLSLEVTDAAEVAPGVVVCHASTELRGDERSPGETRKSLITFVVTGSGHEWRIAAAHNTFIVER